MLLIGVSRPDMCQKYVIKLCCVICACVVSELDRNGTKWWNWWYWWGALFTSAVSSFTSIIATRVACFFCSPNFYRVFSKPINYLVDWIIFGLFDMQNLLIVICFKLKDLLSECCLLERILLSENCIHLFIASSVIACQNHCQCSDLAVSCIGCIWIEFELYAITGLYRIWSWGMTAPTWWFEDLTILGFIVTSVGEADNYLFVLSWF